MSVLGRLFRRAAPPASPRTAQRAFDAARVDRLTAEWLGTAATLDADLRGQLAQVRARARELDQNNDYVRRFLGMVVRGVVGPTGFRLQSRVGGADDGTNAAIEAAFDAWSQSCDAAGRLSFADACRMIVRTVARDGEAVIRKVRGSAAGNAAGLALQLIDPARLDVTYNVAPATGRNQIAMGVEVDASGRPVAYHVLDRAPGGLVSPTRRQRLPASDICHVFHAEQPEQTRGVSWLHSAMVRLHHLKGYDEAAIIAARIGASKMGMYLAPDGDPSQVSEEQPDGTFAQTAEPGEFSIAPRGWDFKEFNPAYPHEQYDAFVKACLRGIASGLDVSYHALANDLEGVNFSSIRSGTLEDRDHWMTLQDWFIGAFLDPLYDEFLRSALLTGAIDLPLARIDDYRAHQWQGRRWQWVDPLKDVSANVMAMQNYIASPQQIAAQSGRDLDDVLADMSAYFALLAAHGLPIPAAQPGAVSPTAVATAAAASDAMATADEQGNG